MSLFVLVIRSCYFFQAKQAVLPGTRDVRLDPNNLTFKYDVTIDILEGDSKGMLTTVARDKSCFKIRENVTKRVVLCLEQVTNKTLNIERFVVHYFF